MLRSGWLSDARVHLLFLTVALVVFFRIPGRQEVVDRFRLASGRAIDRVDAAFHKPAPSPFTRIAWTERQRRQNSSK
jgi:hypothetical protein